VFDSKKEIGRQEFRSSEFQRAKSETYAAYRLATSERSLINPFSGFGLNPHAAQKISFATPNKTFSLPDVGFILMVRGYQPGEEPSLGLLLTLSGFCANSRFKLE
jgi:hypothetical protein